MSDSPTFRPWQGDHSWLSLGPDDWVMFTTPLFSKVGQVVSRAEQSIVIHLQAHALETVLPDGYSYWVSTDPLYSLARCAEPDFVVPPPTGDTMTVRQAAALLGTTAKETRRLLREGLIGGEQRGKTWVVTEAPGTISRRAAARQLDTD